MGDAVAAVPRPAEEILTNLRGVFPPPAQPIWYEGLYYAAANREAKASSQKKCQRKLWFHTQPLSEFDTRRPRNIQLITQSHGKSKIEDPSSKGWTWFEIRICRSTQDAEQGISRKLDNDQLLEWYSHRHHFQSEDEEWCRGRVFKHGDALLKHLQAGDVIAVYISASANRANHAKNGILLFDCGIGCGNSQSLVQLPHRDNPPQVLAYGEKRRECLLSPSSGSPLDRTSDFIDGGVDLMERLLQSEDGNWTAEHRYLKSKHAAPEPHTIFELVKSGDEYRTVNQYTLQERPPAPQPAQQPGAGEIQEEANEPDDPSDQTKPKIIVWNDSGVDRTDFARANARLLVYQMSAPLFTGSLWDKAIQATKEKGQRVLVVVDAEDLRAHGFHISRRVSWEKTIEDFRAHFNEFIKDLHKNMHLIVRLGYEGAIYVRPKAWDEGPAHMSKKSQFYCYLVPDKAEGDLLRYHGMIPGIDMAFVAGLVASLVRESEGSLKRICNTQIGAAVELALIWSHRFAGVRFCKDGDNGLNYPCPKHFDLEALPKPRLISLAEEELGYTNDGDWSLFTLLRRFQDQVSSDLVTRGSTGWLESTVPTARFGNLLTADRTEIECYRSTAAVIEEYLASPPGKPLSIGVFGSPGSGKSFGVTEVIKTMVPKFNKDEDLIEVNLSQFLTHSELLATFHRIRDLSLNRKTPVVLFDEFDSVFERQELGWLKYFLAPMQDGYFLEDGQQHTLKEAIFIFIGGTSSTYADFINGMHDNSEHRRAKKPDFASRLSAYIDIKGLNKGGKEDEMYTIRRAMILRGALTKRLNVTNGKDIPVDDRVLKALLKQTSFFHGARSIILILQMSALSGRTKFEASALPPDDQLGMHVDMAEFKKRIRKDIHDQSAHQVDEDVSKQIDVQLRQVLMAVALQS
ncbi:hypothetical protein NW762_011088 [Fusarium torreyae]|uniref:ATPase AAA-type core domain-containing protein n=1 Tax=Fusarium torreyae TaxID=1237075 RepID=A0A9W8VCV1_9HYPO|nr:hypothetical protein NW762_011088 [Fusarium torreyae]